jgi:hypothetical protein
LRPLFHVFGILPQDAVALQNSFTQSGILPSHAVYNRLQAYFDLIPEDNDAFVDYALSVYPELYTEGPTSDPDYGVGWHYLRSLEYDAAEAQELTAILQSIMDLYYPEGEPIDNGIPDVCCLLDGIQIDMLDEEIIVTGGVAPYEVSSEVSGDIMTVSVVDFDGCEASEQFTITGIEEEGSNDVSIYPNPASAEIYVNFTGTTNEIKYLSLISMNGRELIQSAGTNFLSVSEFSQGVYILQIELQSGERISKRVSIVR